MLICIVLLYFCLMCSAIWLAFFPSGRQFVARRVAATGQRLDQSLARWQHQRSIDAGRWRDATRDGGRRQLKFVRRHAWALAAGVAVIAVPTVLALMMRTPEMVPVYAASRAMPDAQVAALLKGEQLVAPSTLPPMAFTTAEVELVRPMLVDASRNFGLLHPDFNQRLLMAFKIMREQHGYEMALLEGYRSPARQDLLASMGSQVSNARAFQSYHQYGLAADCAFWRDGKLVISEKDTWAMRGYRLYGEVAESLGLTWGGRWTMMDFGHTELRLRGVLGK